MKGDIPKRPNRSFQANVKLSRDAEGRLRRAEEREIADIWAERDRIRLAEAIEADKRRAEKRRRRQNKELAITLDFSKMKSIKLSSAKRLLKFLPKKIPSMIVLSIVAVLFVGLCFNLLHGGNLPGKHANTDKKRITSGDSKVLAAEDEVPNYKTLLPTGTTIKELGGWHRVSPPDRNPVFAYADTIGGVSVTVSQQPLPDSFKADVDGSVSKLAASYSAKDEVPAGDAKVFVGTSVKGPQSAIMVKQDVLVLIKSTSKISDKNWSDYAFSLQ